VNAFTTSDGLRIAYRRSGTGPALVLLHGFIADGRVWRTQIDDFSRDFDVIAWDAPGCGQSCDTPEDFSMQDYARCLLALLDEAGVEAPHLLGLSWGGTLALEFHRLFPQHVRSMIIADSYGGRVRSARRTRKHGSTGACESHSCPPPTGSRSGCPAHSLPEHRKKSWTNWRQSCGTSIRWASARCLAPCIPTSPKHSAAYRFRRS
jgi:pimeloyl-ACP methyl ester carboxylesterase